VHLIRRILFVANMVRAAPAPGPQQQTHTGGAIMADGSDGSNRRHSLKAAAMSACGLLLGAGRHPAPRGRVLPWGPPLDSDGHPRLTLSGATHGGQVRATGRAADCSDDARWWRAVGDRAAASIRSRLITSTWTRADESAGTASVRRKLYLTANGQLVPFTPMPYKREML